MKRHRNIVNVALLSIMVITTGYMIYTCATTDDSLTIRHYIGIVATALILSAYFINKNVFNLLLGISLLIGNFRGLSSFHDIYSADFWFHLGSLNIPLYWGQPIYSVMLLIYLIFNKDFYIGIFGKEYWNGFMKRTVDWETDNPTVTDGNLNHSGDQKPVSPPKPVLSQEEIDKFKEKYANKSLEELTELSKDTRFVPEARQASLELINERKSRNL